MSVGYTHHIRLKQSTWAYASTTVACLGLALFCLISPVSVRRPFRGQGPHELVAALFVERYRALVMIACLLVSLFAAARYWRLESRRWRRIGVAIAVAAVLATGALSRVNVYELMFHPDSAPSFESAARSTLNKDEMVIAVRVQAASRAYPVRSMSYHHVVNDTVGGVPIVATY